jgi:uncharacterized surface protein with fasciclin (FAS1) repeats
MRRLPITAVAATAAALAAAAPASATANTNIVATAKAAGNFKTLVSLVRQAGLARTLKTGGQFTVLAPTDKAFAKVPRSTLKALGNDRAMLRKVLLHHVVAGRLPAAKVVKRHSLKTLNGDRVRVRTRNGKVFVGGARVVQANVKASNGVIHAINKVLIPR